MKWVVHNLSVVALTFPRTGSLGATNARFHATKKRHCDSENIYV
jgi:hypothetical protein